jgi:tRNA (cytidine/uridine-2'-O-)-methyltransferase
MLHVVLYQPEIPQNTGNVGRTCAANGIRLHLVHPLGFAIDDRNLRRAGMDYWQALDLVEHPSWQAFCDSPARPQRLWLLTTQGAQGLWQVRFADGDGLLFGRETSGCPAHVHAWVGADRRVRIPQRRPGMRSLNLSTAVGIVVYEALRQLDA